MLTDLLKQHFGYEQFREGQEAVVNSVISGRSAAAIFPTGSGKSLCYQLPALALPNLTLVISPLLALMQDQIQFLNNKGIAAASIDSSQSREQTNKVMRDIRDGSIKILMVSVERLKNERFRRFLQSIEISLLVVDEAHCISEWGHNFRPDYLKLPFYQSQFNIPQALLLTATATPQVVADMASKFQINQSDIQITGFYRANLHLSVEGVSDQNKLSMLEQWLFHEARFKPIFRGETRNKKDRRAEIEPTIIYVTLQQTAEIVSAELGKLGFNVKAYHAGMNSEDRQIIQTDFMANNIDIIVATIAFGMGVDKSNIRHVVHYDLPKSIENYSQEVGRAGRDGAPSECLVLANRDSLAVLENFVYGDTPEFQGISLVINNILSESNRGRWETQLYHLSNESNIRQLPLKTLLVYLELQGIIQPLYSYFAEYKFKLKHTESEIIAQFNGERGEFVRALFQYSVPAKSWWTVDIDTIVAQYNLNNKNEVITDRNRVVKALEYLDEKGEIELQTKQLTDVYQVTSQTIDAQQLAEQLTLHFEQKQQAEIQRIHNMVSLFERQQCLSFQLASYFGDIKAPVHCGHCSVCTGHTSEIPQRPQLPEISTEQLQLKIRSFLQIYSDKFDRPPTATAVTRFLTGVMSPELTKLRAKTLDGFGYFQAYDYKTIFNQVAKSLDLQGVSS